jgi:hypothetical protein
MTDNNSDTIVDKNPQFSNDLSFEEKSVTPRDRLIFAYWVLSSLFILFLLSGIAHVFYPSSDIFESCKTILPPIATLIIGYYFGERD